MRATLTLNRLTLKYNQITLTNLNLCHSALIYLYLYLTLVTVSYSYLKKILIKKMKLNLFEKCVN